MPLRQAKNAGDAPAIALRDKDDARREAGLEQSEITGRTVTIKRPREELMPSGGMSPTSRVSWRT